MQILKYYINYKGGVNNRLVCRIVNRQLHTIKAFTGKKAEEKAEKYIHQNRQQLWNAYNSRGININPYAPDAKKMPLRSLTTVGMDLNAMGFPNFSATGSVEGMKKQYYGKGALLVRDGDYIYNVTSAPDIYYQHAVN